MAKNKRKRKLKEQDFQKVKLKVGKKLQPAQNATDTSFKSRSIFIPTQLQKDLEPTNQRNQTLKDLLAQVGHYSATTRQEALVGLKDLFQCHEYLLEDNLGIIIKRVAERMTDSEPSVRQSLLLLLCFIFPMVPQERMAPFSSLIVAHLSCAMTHIYDDIQHDSLGFLELCLRYFPNFMVTSSVQLIHNFVGMISHQSSPGGKKSKGLQLAGGKGLSVNPKGKLSSLRSRLKVLQQLLAFLKALELSSNPRQENGTLCSEKNGLSTRKPIFYFSRTQPTQVQILQHSVDEPKFIPFQLDDSSTFSQSPMGIDGKSNILTDEEQAKDFMEIIVPLLLECWIECNPAEMTTGLQDSVSSSAIDVMLAIVEIFKVVLKASQNNQWKICSISEHKSVVICWYDKYLKGFNHHFMTYFPFTANPTPSFKKGKRKLGKSSQQVEGENRSASVLTLNLSICEIMLQFLSNGVASQKKLQLSVKKLEEFVIESLQLKALGGDKAQLFQTEHVESLVKFAEKIITHHCSSDQKEHDCGIVKELLDASFVLYQSSHIMSGTKQVLMMFFANLAFSENLSLSRNEVLYELIQRWLAGMPSLLVQLKSNSPSLTELVLGILKKAVMQQRLILESNFFQYLAAFFSKSNGPFGSLSETVQRSAVEVLFHLPTLDGELFKVIVTCCQGGHVSVSVVKYILQVLHYRSPCYNGCLSSPAAFSLPLYLSGLLSIAVGFSRQQLGEYQDAKIEEKTLLKLTELKECSFVILEEISQTEQSGVESPVLLQSDEHMLGEEHQIILQAVCECYKQSKQSNLLLQYMTSPMETLMKDFKVLPLSSVHSLLCIIRCLLELAAEPGSTSRSHLLPAKMMSNLAQLCLVCFQYSTTHGSCTEGLSGDSSTSKRLLFDAVVQLLLTEPEIIKDMLSLLFTIVSENSESVKQNSAAILTKVLSCDLRKIHLRFADIVQQIVSRILCPAEHPVSHLSQCFADLRYQYSLFKVEAGLS